MVPESRKTLYKKRMLCLLLALLLSGCGWGGGESPSPSPSLPEETPSPPPSPSPSPYIIKDAGGDTVETRFNPPEGFSRVSAEEGSFGVFLREYPLKQDGDVIYLYDGTIKPGADFEAVLKMELHQNRDIMRNTHFLLRMRAEYLYQAERYDDIKFHFLSGFLFDFATWSQGSRLKESNNKVQWQAASAAADSGLESFKEYMKWLYVYTNKTAVMQDLLQSPAVETGCVFIDAGGAVIADMAQDENGNTALLLIRAGEPEQEGYVVKNTEDTDNSPWFILPDNGILKTPEGELSVGQLYVFR